MSNAFSDFGSVGRSVGLKKKKNLKKNSQEVSEYLALVSQDDVIKVDIHIIWINKMDNILYNMFMFLFLLFSVLLLCSFFRLKELFHVRNGLTTSLLFFCFENAKNLGGSDDAKRRKKREWSYTITVFVLTFRLPKERGNKTVKFTAALPLVPRLEDMFYSDIG